ncbi:MAG TPA: glutamine-hydrolyzing GMP synthase [Candidatus Polarisedimenticolia bacterium]|jgi:GMP synthase (glutamine-hydrolysing)|nr:glutamine-hydrolyzing GMP synthase [Candidatus Polarisedimenticolia bacterium]
MSDDGVRHERVVVLDYGSQTSQLIARRVRDLSVYCELLPCTAPFEAIATPPPRGLILSGGPDSVYREGAPDLDSRLVSLEVPILGICYGMQLMGKTLGGRVKPSAGREFGRARLQVTQDVPLFAGLASEQQVWMSHGDSIEEPPPGFVITARTDATPCAAMADSRRALYAIQFHPEVAHTLQGREILRNFLYGICGCRGDWNIASVSEEIVEGIRRRVGAGRVVLGISGGVDSTVAAALLHRAIGDRLHPIFVDTGLLRQGEGDDVERALRDQLAIPLARVDASSEFLAGLSGIEDPEEKRRVIGRVFVAVFEREAAKLGKVDFLAQGTLYPDVIESTSFAGPSAVIKTHHNVGGLPEKMRLKLVEPLRELFKDEVRRLGATLGIPAELLGRHPFPGPGLAVRLLGAVTRERLEILRQADAIFIAELRGAGLYDQVAQAFAVLLPVKSVGVMGDYRTYENVCALRAVTTDDFMTADWARLPHDFLAAVSTRIVNEVRGINRVVYDVSSKPPSTIEWE